MIFTAAFDAVFTAEAIRIVRTPRSHNRTTLSAPTRRRPHQAGAAWYAGGRPERSL